MPPEGEQLRSSGLNRKLFLADCSDPEYLNCTSEPILGMHWTLVYWGRRAVYWEERLAYYQVLVRYYIDGILYITINGLKGQYGVLMITLQSRKR
jgi:hypothetical protein